MSLLTYEAWNHIPSAYILGLKRQIYTAQISLAAREKGRNRDGASDRLKTLSVSEPSRAGGYVYQGGCG